MSAVEELRSAIEQYHAVFGGDLGWVHGYTAELQIGEAPRSGVYSYIEPTEDSLASGSLRLLVHGCIDKRVVRFTYEAMKIDGVGRVMTTSAGGAEQYEVSSRFDALVGYLSAVRNASERAPEMLLLVHAGGSEEVGECGGFKRLAGPSVVQGFRDAGNIEDMIVWRAKQTRDAVWARSRSSGGTIDVGCVMISSQDEALYIDRF